MSIVSAREWKVFIDDNPNAHLLQSSEWGELKEKFGWKAVRVIVENTGTQILLRRIAPGVKIAYIPKGPVGVSWEYPGVNKAGWTNLLPEIDKICREEKAFVLKIEPDTWEISERNDNDGEIIKYTNATTTPNGFRKSIHSIQPPRTIVVDLKDEDTHILARMKQKTRYNIGLARRKNIVVQRGVDINSFFRLMEETGARDEFPVHDQSYYQTAYDLFHPSGNCELLQANLQDETIAGIMVFSHGNRAWYLYGASSNIHRERMPSYLLQWQALLWAKSKDCQEYDLWGIPDENLNVLEGQFIQRSDGLWGVYRFKRGFGGEVRRMAGPWDRVYNPIIYLFYSWWMKRISPLQ